MIDSPGEPTSSTIPSGGPICVDQGHRAPRRGGVEPSVGSVGDADDNALAETVIGLFKTELIYRRDPWRTFEAADFATLERVDWFNNRRLPEPIGSIPPAEAEAAYYAQLEIMPMAA
jgi:putative transposase